MPTAPGPSAATELTDLVGGWVAGWARARASTLAPARGGWQIEVVGSPYRSRETVLAEPDDATYAYWAESLTGTAGWWLTVITVAPWTRPHPPGLVVNAVDEALMTTTLAPVRSRPPGVPVELTVEADRAIAAVFVDGERAAEGTAAVVAGTAVFDRIRTADAYQRRGLGRQVMAELSDWAVSRGARTGVLAASIDGQALYRRLGWARAGSLVTVRWDQ